MLPTLLSVLEWLFGMGIETLNGKSGCPKGALQKWEVENIVKYMVVYFQQQQEQLAGEITIKRINLSDDKSFASILGTRQNKTRKLKAKKLNGNWFYEKEARK